MLKVLLVDDEPFIVQGLSALIDWEKEGFEIVGTAGNGSEAVEFLKSNPVDLILADIKMPVMNGLEFLKYIRETHLSEAFFVILSGYGDFTYAKEAIKWQCTDYILKPIQKSQLLALLSKVKQMQQDKKEESERIRKIGKAYFVQQMQTLLLGRCRHFCSADRRKRHSLMLKDRWILEEGSAISGSSRRMARRIRT